MCTRCIIHSFYCCNYKFDKVRGKRSANDDKSIPEYLAINAIQCYLDCTIYFRFYMKDQNL